MPTLNRHQSPRPPNPIIIGNDETIDRMEDRLKAGAVDVELLALTATLAALAVLFVGALAAALLVLFELLVGACALILSERTFFSFYESMRYSMHYRIVQSPKTSSQK